MTAGLVVVANAQPFPPLPDEAPVPLSPPRPAPIPEGSPDPAGREDEAEETDGSGDTRSPDEERADASETGGNGAACEAELSRLGAEFRASPPIVGPEGCGIGNPYRIAEAAPGVRLLPEAVLSCEAALALARWVQGTVLPAGGVLGEESVLEAISLGQSYSCRNRRSDDFLSEHAIGNAIDVVSFHFSNRPPIAVRPREGEGNLEEAFQVAVRAGACLYFTTVLGPGADPDHEDHLHLDVKSREGGFRICQ